VGLGPKVVVDLVLRGILGRVVVECMGIIADKF
jgi:hypothetical protein